MDNKDFLDGIVVALFKRDFELYKKIIGKEFNKNGFKLYRYIPIHNISDNVIDNLLNVKQFGMQSLLKKYIYHNKPSYFNDPFDCVFGISASVFFREVISQLVNIKDVEILFEEFRNNKTINDVSEVKDIFQIIDGLNIHDNTKRFMEFVFQIISDSIMIGSAIDFEQTFALFYEKITNNPTIFLNLINPLLTNNIDEQKFIVDLKEKIENIQDAENFVVKVFPSNSDFNSFLTFLNDVNLSPESTYLENKIVDGITNYNEKLFNIIDAQFGIASLTTKYDNPLMWSHYGSGHSGICIEYDFKEYIDNLDHHNFILAPINYANERITFDNNTFEQFNIKELNSEKESIYKLFLKGLLTKHKAWEHESEWRSIKVVRDLENNCDRKEKGINVTALYLGNKMNESMVSEVINILNKNGYQDTPVFKMVNEISEYGIKAVKIK